jgi:hypothetical protein
MGSAGMSKASHSLLLLPATRLTAVPVAKVNPVCAGNRGSCSPAQIGHRLCS